MGYDWGKMRVNNFRPFLRSGFLGFGFLMVTACGGVEPAAPGPQAPTSAYSDVKIGLENEINARAIQNSYRGQAALAQFYRWFQFYDDDQILLQNQLAVLDENALFQTNIGRGEGRNAYVAKIENLPTEWKNSHFVRTVMVNYPNKNSVRLNADIVYMNDGALAQEAVHSSEVKFRVIFEDKSSSSRSSGPSSDTPLALPVMTKVEIAPGLGGITPTYRQSYSDNRLKSLLHYWLYLVENPQRDASQFEEILSDEFKLNFPSGRITSDEGLKEWLAGPASAAQAIHYRVRDFSYDTFDDGEYEIKVELDWYGLMAGGEQLTGRVSQNLLVRDDRSKPFAQIISIREDELVAGTLRPDENDL